MNEPNLRKPREFSGAFSLVPKMTHTTKPAAARSENGWMHQPGLS
jgi:hypothetical protein